MKKIFLFISITLLGFTTVLGQTRYIDEVFTNVTITSDITYGSNLSVITGSPTLEDLKLDLYEPTGDTASSRPVIIVVHGGSFLPLSLNTFCVGTKQDSQVVEICTRLAKCGYVVAAIDYRLGWNPTASTQELRTGAYLNAYYRCVQDIHNAIRFFKWSVDNGNPYAVANDKFSVIGEECGGSCALAVGSLDDPAELNLSKFLNMSTMTSYIDQSLSGNIEGTDTVPLNIGNYSAYTSEVNLVANLGGAVGDSSWVEAGDPPVVSFHCPTDPYNPYAFGAVIIPTNGDFLMNMSGSYHVSKLSNDLGNNDIYVNAAYNDPVTLVANSRNDGNYGLFPFPRPNVEFAPWQWWDTGCTNNSNSLITNPDMSETKAKAYIDTIVWYLTPRIAIANGLTSHAGIADNYSDESVQIYPNPAVNMVNVSCGGSDVIEHLSVLDMTGRLVYSSQVNDTQSSIKLDAFPPGLYLISVQMKDKTIVRKLIIR